MNAQPDLQWPKELLAEAHRRDREGKRTVGLAPEHYHQMCQNCGGLGVMRAFYVDGGPFKYVPSGKKLWHYFSNEDAIYTGETHEAVCPVCAGGERPQWLERLCRLSGYDLDIRLDDFKPYPGKEGARQLMLSLAAMTPAPSGFITFYGDYGRGKTFLLKALVNAFRIAGLVTEYWIMADLLGYIRSRFSDNISAVEEAIERFKHTRILALDEVDKISETGWVRETLHRLLDYRYENQDVVLTLFATNVRPSEQTLEYLGSRMEGGIICDVAGNDMRPAIGLRKRKDWDLE